MNRKMDRKKYESLRKKFDKNFHLVEDMDWDVDLQSDVFNWFIEEIFKWKEKK